VVSCEAEGEVVECHGESLGRDALVRELEVLQIHCHDTRLVAQACEERRQTFDRISVEKKLRQVQTRNRRRDFGDFVVREVELTDRTRAEALGHAREAVLRDVEELKLRTLHQRRGERTELIVIDMK